MLGASSNELAMVAMLLVLVVLAPKVPRIGERIGGWLAGGKAASAEGRPDDDDR